MKTPAQIAKDAAFSLDLLVEDAEELAKATKQLRDIAIRYPDLLRRVCSSGLCGPEPVENSESLGPPRSQRTKRVPPTAAVRQFLGSHPAGSTRRDIVAAVRDKVKSKAGKPADVINAAITVLRRKGEITGEAQEDGPNIYKLVPRNGEAE